MILKCTETGRPNTTYFEIPNIYHKPGYAFTFSIKYPPVIFLDYDYMLKHFIRNEDKDNKRVKIGLAANKLLPIFIETLKSKKQSMQK